MSILLYDETDRILLFEPERVIPMSSLPRHIAAFALTLLCAPWVSAEIVWDEASMGELSDDNEAPTNLNFFASGAGGTVGTSSVVGQAMSNTADIFTFEIPTGNQLSEIVLANYAGGDNAMFVAISAGNTFPNSYDDINNRDPLDPPINTDDWLGGTVTGVFDFDNGIDLLAKMSTGNVAGSGYTPPLGAGKYSFYIQQTGPSNLYTLDFNVTDVSAVPEPSMGLALCAMGIGMVGYRRVRRKSKAQTGNAA